MRLRNIPSARQELADSPYVIEEERYLNMRGHWSELYGNDHPLRIEIGMGKGQFLLELARRHPDINYVGIERYSSVLVHPVRRLASWSSAEGTSDPSAAQTRSDGVHVPSATQARSKDVLDLSDPQETAEASPDFPPRNIFLLRMDAEQLTEVFAPGEVDRIYLNFSDPWPKDRHAKRRLPGRVFLRRYEQVLVPSGRVEFKTDNRLLFDFALEEAREAGWTIDACTYDLHHDSVMNKDNILTEYEKRFSEQGNPICKLIEHPGQ